MSEGPSTGAPRDNAAEGAPAPQTTSRRRRPQRSTLILGAAGVISVTVIAAALLIAVRPATKQLEYSRLPAPCALVSPATVAKYLPNPAATPESLPGGSSYRADTCKWSSNAGGEDRTLVAQVVVFGSSSAITSAQQSYNVSVSTLGCHCKGVAVSTRPVTGLGDEAAAFFITASQDADVVTAPNASDPGANLIARSSNAVIGLNYDIMVPATGAALPTGAAQLTGMVAVARGILAALARPAAVSSVPVSAEPHYTGSRDVCRLIAAATLAKYAPDATVTPQPSSITSSSHSGAPQLSQCAWGSSSNFVLLTLWGYHDAPTAQQNYVSAAEAFSRSTTGQTVTGSVWMPDVGEEATAIFQSRSGGSQGVDMVVWSGNDEIDLWYADTGSSPPDRATLLAGGIAMARDTLAALARPAASSLPQGPLYASPRDPCRLVKASTLAIYAPGSTTSQFPGPNTGGTGPQMSNCNWNATTGSIVLDLNVYPDPDSAQGGFQFDVQYAHQEADTVIHGSQSVKGLGEQAIAVFETQMGNSPAVALYVLSGNAEIQVSYTNVPFSTPVNRATMLAGAVAMARDVLRDLPPGKPPAG